MATDKEKLAAYGVRVGNVGGGKGTRRAKPPKDAPKSSKGVRGRNYGVAIDEIKGDLTVELW